MGIILGQSNIDNIRAEISELEDAKVFDQRAWAKVLIALSDSPCRRADAVRRMEAAKGNAVATLYVVKIPYPFPEVEFCEPMRVVVETEAV